MLQAFAYCVVYSDPTCFAYDSELRAACFETGD
jgi:hypothetical protein